MDIFMDPHIWAGLLTLVILEIVLGIDNLVFIAILADKLPPHQRDKARIIGLSLALLMRLVLLASISWIMSLEVELITLFGNAFTGRDMILLGGGFFLLYKATSEIHERIEGSGHGHKNNAVQVGFGMVIAQIIVLDAVFSLDAVITAVGMVEDIEVMMLAVCIAMSLMIFASKPLTAFVLAHPTVIMLCLGFLLLVGFSLVAEGLGFHMPKGYLYAAIGFSILIEVFNQTSTIKRRRRALSAGDVRQRTADAVMRILSGKSSGSENADDVGALVHQASANGGIFSPEEQEMIQGVLYMTERPIRTIMTPRHELDWLDLNDAPENILNDIRSTPHSAVIACEGDIDEVVGILRKADMVKEMMDGKNPDLRALVRTPLIVHENLSILKTLDMFKKSPVHMALILDEYGSLEGIVTLTDIVEMIAGNLPEYDGDDAPEIMPVGQDRFIMDAMVSIYDFGDKIGTREFPEGDFSTLAGFLLHIFERLPNKGDSIRWGGWKFTVQGMDKNRIASVLVVRDNTAKADA